MKDKEITIAYKVLKVGRFGLVSCVDTAMRQFYAPPGQWTEPAVHGSKLLCFVDLEKAQAFKHQNRGQALYRVEARDAESIEYVSMGMKTLSAMMRFWGLDLRGRYDVMEAPWGSLQCTAMRLLERIDA